MADDAELPYLRGVAHVRTDAGAVIVIAYADYAQGFRNIFWQFAQVDSRCGRCGCEGIRTYSPSCGSGYAPPYGLAILTRY